MSENELNRGLGDTLQARLDSLPVEDREKLEKSWDNLRAITPEKEQLDGVSISKVEFYSPEERKAKVDEMQRFLLEAFEGKEMVDEMQMDIGVQYDIVDYYEARNAEGELISLLSSQMVESKNKAGDSELSMVVWYVANKPGYKGKSVVKELGTAAMSDFLEKAQDQLKPAKAILGEAELGDEDETRREKVFNRYADMKRLYSRKKNGQLCEVLYEAPPEDESTEGDKAHFMARMIDGSETISKEDYLSLIDGIHGQYTRPEYFTPEYFTYLAKEEGEEINPEDVTPEAVNAYRQRYLGIAAKIRTKLEKKLKSAQGDLVFLSERERRENN